MFLLLLTLKASFEERLEVVVVRFFVELELSHIVDVLLELFWTFDCDLVGRVLHL